MDEYRLKIVIIGISNVGKSALLTRYTDDTFNLCDAYNVTAVFKVKNVTRMGKMAKVQFIDTALLERLVNQLSHYCRGADGLVLVFDVTKVDSFDTVPSLLAKANAQVKVNCVTILVGNKIDLPTRAVDRQTAQDFADNHGIQYIETSAKTGFNVHQVFDSMVDDILKIKMATNSMEQMSIDIQSQDVSQKSRCY